MEISNTDLIIEQLVQLKTITHEFDLIHPIIIPDLYKKDLIRKYGTRYYLSERGMDTLIQIDSL